MKQMFFYLLIIIAFTGCESHPPLEITPMGSYCLDFDFEIFGEYATMIDLIEISEVETHEILWSVKPKAGKIARVAGFDLCRGSNPRKLEIFGTTDSFLYWVKDNKDSFILKGGKKYRIRVVSPEYRRIAIAEFSFPVKTNTEYRGAMIDWGMNRYRPISNIRTDK